MIALLGKMRKQMNGAVADAMRYYGKDYGLNYGVSLPTVRSIARSEEQDHEFALYLYSQQVRELKLAAMHIAQAELLDVEQASTWEQGLINSEIAEECAFALLRHSAQLKDIFQLWIAGENMFATYAALMAMARSQFLSKCEVEKISAIVKNYPDSRPIAQGAVALLDTAYQHNELQSDVRNVLASLSPCPTADYISDEMSWRIPETE